MDARRLSALFGFASAAALGALCLAQTRGAGPAAANAVRSPGYDAAGHLPRPPDLDRWVFLGASLGMDYNGDAFTVDHPGLFHVVLMEPSAYEYFKGNGKYADGSMFLLSFYDTQLGSAIGRTGYAPGPLNSFEIHIVDHRRYPEGHAFFLYGKSDTRSTALPPGSPCVKCHVPNGAFDGTFAQFYPSIRERIAK